MEKQRFKIILAILRKPVNNWARILKIKCICLLCTLLSHTLKQWSPKHSFEEILFVLTPPIYNVYCKGHKIDTVKVSLKVLISFPQWVKLFCILPNPILLHLLQYTHTLETIILNTTFFQNWIAYLLCNFLDTLPSRKSFNAYISNSINSYTELEFLLLLCSSLSRFLKLEIYPLKISNSYVNKAGHSYLKSEFF